MVKLYYLAVLWRPPEGTPGGAASGGSGSSLGVRCLKSASDLSSFGFFQRSSVAEFMRFTAKMVAERSGRPSRSSVKEQEYLCHVFVRADGLAGVLVSDEDYPPRAAHSLLTKLLDEFTGGVPAAAWPSLPENAPSTFHALEPTLFKWQNPREADAVSRLEADLDETKIVLHSTIASLLERGEKLDDLVAKSEDLSAQSKVFYKTARKTNQCCTYL